MNFLVRLAVFAVALMLAGPAPAAELQFPPGSRIGLVPPPGYTASSKFLGFEGGPGKAGIFITELAPQTYTRLAREFTAEAVRNSGMDVVSREEFALPGGPAVLVSARYEVSGVTLRKWALSALAGDIALVVVMRCRRIRAQVTRPCARCSRACRCGRSGRRRNCSRSCPIASVISAAFT